MHLDICWYMNCSKDQEHFCWHNNKQLCGCVSLKPGLYSNKHDPKWNSRVVVISQQITISNVICHLWFVHSEAGLASALLNGQITNWKRRTVKMLPGSVILCPGPVPGLLGWACPKQLGLSSTACGLVLGNSIPPYIHSFTELGVWRLWTNHRPCSNSVPYTSGTTWSTRSDGFGWRNPMLA